MKAGGLALPFTGCSTWEHLAFGPYLGSTVELALVAKAQVSLLKDMRAGQLTLTLVSCGNG